MPDKIKEAFSAVKNTGLFLDEKDFRDQITKSPKDVFSAIGNTGLFVDYDDFETSLDLKKKDAPVSQTGSPSVGKPSEVGSQLPSQSQSDQPQPKKEKLGDLFKSATAKIPEVNEYVAGVGNISKIDPVAAENKKKNEDLFNQRIGELSASSGVESEFIKSTVKDFGDYDDDVIIAKSKERKDNPAEYSKGVAANTWKKKLYDAVYNRAKEENDLNPSEKAKVFVNSFSQLGKFNPNDTYESKKKSVLAISNAINENILDKDEKAQALNALKVDASVLLYEGLKDQSVVNKWAQAGYGNILIGMGLEISEITNPALATNLNERLNNTLASKDAKQLTEKQLEDIGINALLFETNRSLGKSIPEFNKSVAAYNDKQESLEALGERLKSGNPELNKYISTISNTVKELDKANEEYKKAKSDKDEFRMNRAAAMASGLYKNYGESLMNPPQVVGQEKEIAEYNSIIEELRKSKPENKNIATIQAWKEFAEGKKKSQAVRFPGAVNSDIDRMLLDVTEGLETPSFLKGLYNLASGTVEDGRRALEIAYNSMTKTREKRIADDMEYNYTNDIINSTINAADAGSTLTQQDYIPQLKSPELQKQFDAVMKDNKLSRQEKYKKLFPLMKDVFVNGEIDWVYNPNKGNISLTAKSIFHLLSTAAVRSIGNMIPSLATGGAIPSLLVPAVGAAVSKYDEEFASGNNNPLAPAIYSGGVVLALGNIMDESAALLSALKGAKPSLAASRPSLTTATKQFAKMQGGETIEELGTELLDGDIVKNYKEVIIGTLIASAPINGAVAAIQNRTDTELYRQGWFEAGVDKPMAMAGLNKLRDAGTVNQAQYDVLAKRIDRAVEIVKDMPLINKKGKILTDTEKAKYVDNLLKKYDSEVMSKNLPSKMVEEAKALAKKADEENAAILEGPELSKIESGMAVDKEGQLIEKKEQMKEKFGLKDEDFIEEPPSKERDAADRDALPESEFKTEEELINFLENGEYAMLTGQNPDAIPLSKGANKTLNEKAQEWLGARGLKPTPLFGKYGNSEGSFLVPKMTKEQSIEFAKEFQQDSVAHSSGLVYKDGSFNPRSGKPTVENLFDQDEDFFSTINIGGKKVDFRVPYDFDTKMPAEVKKSIADEINEEVFGRNESEIDTTLGKIQSLAEKSLAKFGIKLAITDSSGKGQASGAQGLFDDKTGVVTIDKAKLRDTKEAAMVAWHESAHPVMNALRNENRELYDALVRGMRDAASGNPELAQIFKWAETEYTKNTLSNDDGSAASDQEVKDVQNDESIVEFVGKVNAGVIDINSIDVGLKQKIIDFINYVANLLGLDPVLDTSDTAKFKKTVSEIAKALATGRDITEVIGEGGNIKSDLAKYSGPFAVPGDGVNVNFQARVGEGLSPEVSGWLTKEMIKSIDEISQYRISRVVFYDNTRVGEIRVANRVTGEVSTVNGMGGFGYSHVPIVEKNGGVLAFTSPNQAIQILKRMEMFPDSIMAVAMQNQLTSHLGNLDTMDLLWGPKGVFELAAKTKAAERDIVTIFKESLVSIQKTRKNDQEIKALQSMIDDAKRAKTVSDIYTMVMKPSSFGTRNIVNSNMLQDKPTKITAGTRESHRLLHYKYGIPTLQELADAVSEDHFKNAETGDIIKYVRPFNDKKIYTTSQEEYDKYTQKPTPEMVNGGYTIELLPPEMAHKSYPFVIKGENIGFGENYIGANEVFGEVKEKGITKSQSFFPVGRMKANAPSGAVPADATRYGSPIGQASAGNRNLVPEAKQKKLTDDGKGNYVFFHRTGQKLSKIDPKKFGSNNATGRDERPGVGISMFYTDNKTAEPGVPDNFIYAVRVPKEKVYPINEDPLNLYDEAKAMFEKDFPGQAFDANKQVGYITKVANEKGFEMSIIDWNMKGTKAPRAQTTIAVKPELYKSEEFINGSVRPKYNEELDKLKPGIRKGQASAGNRNLAPNGNPSNLNDKQYKQVRTPEFKKWFGDWENDPKNASKVVDENGEPRVVYHGTNESFDTFSKEELGSKNWLAESAKMGFFFAGDKKTSEAYTGMNSMDMAGLSFGRYDKIINKYKTEQEAIKADIQRVRDSVRQKEMDLLAKGDEAKKVEQIRSELRKIGIEEDVINQMIKEVLDLHVSWDKIDKLANAENEANGNTKRQKDLNNKIYDEIEEQWKKETGATPRVMELFLNIKDPKVVDYTDIEETNLPGDINEGIGSGKDGVIFNNLADGADADDIFVAFEPNQIKSATDNSGAFSTADNRIQASAGQRTAADFGESADPKTKITLADLGVTAGMSSQGLLDSLIKFNGTFTPLLKAIAKKKNLGELKIASLTEITDDPSEAAGGFLSKFTDGVEDRFKGKLYINEEADNQDFSTKNQYYTLTHELMHWVTLDSINTPIDSPAYDKLKDIYNVLSKNADTSPGFGTFETYGLSNFNEFMAELFISAKFQNYVKDVMGSNDDLRSINNDSKDLITLLIDYLKGLYAKVFGETGPINENTPLIDQAIKVAKEMFFSDRMQASLGKRKLEQDQDFKLAAYVMRKKAEGTPIAEIAMGIMSAIPGMTVQEVNNLVSDPEQYIRTKFKYLSPALLENLISRAGVKNIYRKSNPNVEKAFDDGKITIPDEFFDLAKEPGKVKQFISDVKDKAKKVKDLYFNAAKGLPDWVLALKDISKGVADLEIRKAIVLARQLNTVAKSIGFTEWDKFSAAMKSMSIPKQESGLQPWYANVAAENARLAAFQTPEIMALPEEMRPYVYAMRGRIDDLTRDLITGGFVTPEQALTLEENIGAYSNRAFRMYNENGYKPTPEAVRDAVKYLANIEYAKIVSAKLGMISKEDAMIEAKNIAKKQVKSILDKGKGGGVFGKGSSRDIGILKKREEIAEPILKLMGEYTDPATVFVMTVAKQAALKSASQYLTGLRNTGLGNIFFEKDDPSRPMEFGTPITSDTGEAMSPLNGLVTTEEIAKVLNETTQTINSAVEKWMSLVGAVRWGKTVLSPVTQAKNFESNLGFAVMNGLIFTGASGEAFKGAGQYWSGEIKGKELSELAEKVMTLGLVNQSVGMSELRQMLGSGDIHSIAVDLAVTGKSGKAKNWVGKSIDGLNKVYQLSDDFWKVYAYMNERHLLSEAMYGTKYESLTTDQQTSVDIEASERVKNTWPTYDRVWEGAKYISQRMPIFGNFISFQAESVRVLGNTARIAVSDLKSDNPAIKALGMRRLGGMIAYSAIRSFVTYGAAHMFGIGVKGIIGLLTNSGDEEDKKEALKDALPGFMRTSDVIAVPNGDGKFIVFDLSSIDPYNVTYKTLNALTEGREGVGGIKMDPGPVAAIAEFLSGFLELEMTFDTFMEISKNINYKNGDPIYTDEDENYEVLLKLSGYAASKLKPSAVGLLERLMGDNRAAEGAALLGARPYEVDLYKSFSINMSRTTREFDPLLRKYGALKRDTEMPADERKKKIEELEESLGYYATRLNKTYMQFILLGADVDKMNDIVNDKSAIKMTGWNKPIKNAIKYGKIDPKTGRVDSKSFLK